MSKTFMHQRLVEKAQERLMEEGYNPLKIRVEEPFFTITNKKYILDVVGMQNGEIDTVIECGNCSPDKLAVLKSYFKRVIHMPYQEYFDVKDKLLETQKENKRLQTRIENLVDKIRELETKLEDPRHQEFLEWDSKFLKSLTFNQIADICFEYLQHEYIYAVGIHEEQKNNFVIRFNKHRFPPLKDIPSKTKYVYITRNPKDKAEAILKLAQIIKEKVFNKEFL